MLARNTTDIHVKTPEAARHNRSWHSNARFKQTFELGIMFAPFVGRSATGVCRSMHKPLLDNRIETPVADSRARGIIKDFSGLSGGVCFHLRRSHFQFPKDKVHDSIGLGTGQCQIDSFVQLLIMGVVLRKWIGRAACARRSECPGKHAGIGRQRPRRVSSFSRAGPSVCWGSRENTGHPKRIKT